jgi:hypothetical protein
MKRITDPFIHPEDAVSVKVAADFLGGSPVLVSNLLNTGALEAFRLPNKQVRIKLASLHRFVRAQKYNSPNDFYFWNASKPDLPELVTARLVNLPIEDVRRLIQKGILKDRSPEAIRQYLFESQWQTQRQTSPRKPAA